MAKLRVTLRILWRMISPVLMLVAAMWLVHVINIALGGGLTRMLGLVPREITGLDGIVAMPFLHGNWEHLLANTVPLVILGVLIALLAPEQFYAALLGGIVLTGSLAWLFARPHNHIGASGLVFAWFGFLVSWGLLVRSWRAVLGAGVALFLYGVPTLFGIVATSERVSWDGHLAGLAAGSLTAWYCYRGERRLRARRKPWQ
ncbi:MAG: rhomboid family intramembrane serine protease [Neomegalonema sp.]|nr:rhomboid family intramembrane serine protease [Neomegalonema sp.]